MQEKNRPNEPKLKKGKNKIKTMVRIPSYSNSLSVVSASSALKSDSLELILSHLRSTIFGQSCTHSQSKQHSSAQLHCCTFSWFHKSERETTKTETRNREKRDEMQPLSASSSSLLARGERRRVGGECQSIALGWRSGCEKRWASEAFRECAIATLSASWEIWRDWIWI